MVRILLVHDEALTRSALISLLHLEPDLKADGTAWPGALHTARLTRPQVSVVDGEGPGAMGPLTVAQLSQLRAVAGALVVLGAAHRPGPLHRAFRARALGFVAKDSQPAALAAAVRAAAAGRRHIDPALGQGFLRAAQTPLTERELGILALAAAGASNQEIADRLHLSYGTVRNYLSAITRKTGARNRLDAIRRSQAAGWV